MPCPPRASPRRSRGRCRADRTVEPRRVDRSDSGGSRYPGCRAADVGEGRRRLADHRRAGRAGMADVCLTAVGVETSAAAVARHYGARSADWRARRVVARGGGCGCGRGRRGRRGPRGGRPGVDARRGDLGSDRRGGTGGLKRDGHTERWAEAAGLRAQSPHPPHRLYPSGAASTTVVGHGARGGRPAGKSATDAGEPDVRR